MKLFREPTGEELGRTRTQLRFWAIFLAPLMVISLIGFGIADDSPVVLITGVGTGLLVGALVYATRRPWVAERTGKLPLPVALTGSLIIFLGFSAFFVYGLLNFDYFDGSYRRSPLLFLLATPIAIGAGAVGVWRAIKRLRD